jgi:hypothetical protein
MGGRTTWLGTIAALAAVTLAVLGAASGARPRARSTYAQQCSSSDTNAHNPANPLDTRGFTGTDPLDNAHLFVESPWLFGGDAADAIAG